MGKIFKMIYLLSGLFFVIFFFSSSNILLANTEDTLNSLFYKANEYYKAGQFEKAVETYEKILSRGYASGNLYYNLANGYYKLNQPGKSLVNYLRAKMFMPRDPDLGYNLEYIITELKLEDENIDQLIPVLGYFTVNEMLMLITTLFALLVGLTLIYLYLPGIKKSVKKLLYIILVTFVLSVVGTGFVIYNTYHSNPAVIISSSANVRFEPIENGQIHFELSEGKIVEIEQIHEGWVLISDPDKKRGWLKASQIEPIRFNN